MSLKAVSYLPRGQFSFYLSTRILFQFYGVLFLHESISGIFATMKYKWILLFLFLSTKLLSQEDDHINWSFNKYSFLIDDQWRMAITPIIRLNQNITNFSDASIDIALSRKMGHGFTIGGVARSWYYPGQKLRQFLWLDLVHKLPNLGIPFTIKQRLRFHGGLDIYDRVDGDFLRYHLGLVGAFEKSIVQPILAVEPFFRFNKLNYFERFRIEYGLSVKASKNLSLFVFMRQQQMYNSEETYTQYLWTTGMQYFFENKLIKKNE